MPARAFSLPGLYTGVLTYQVAYRVSVQWSDRCSHARRRRMTLALKAEFDRRVATCVHSALVMAGCWGVITEDTREVSGDLWRCPAQLPFYLAMCCGHLASDMVRAGILSLSWPPDLALQIYVLAQRSAVGSMGTMVAAAHRLVRLLCCALVAWRGVIGFYTARMLFWDGAMTLILNAHWFMRHSICPVLGRRSPLYYFNGPVMAVTCAWPLLLHCVGSFDVSSDLRWVWSLQMPLDTRAEESRDVLAMQICSVCLLVVVAHNVVVVVLVLAGQVRMFCAAIFYIIYNIYYIIYWLANMLCRTGMIPRIARLWGTLKLSPRAKPKSKLMQMVVQEARPRRRRYAMAL